MGQNQPINATATGIDPHTTAHGEKIDQINMIEVAIAVQKGQMEFLGDASFSWDDTRGENVWNSMLGRSIGATMRSRYRLARAWRRKMLDSSALLTPSAS